MRFDSGKKLNRHVFFIRYRFLVRLIAVGLLVLCVTSLLTTLVISRQSYNRLLQTVEDNIQEVARSIDESLTDTMNLFSEIGRSCIETPYTYETVIKNYLSADRSVKANPSGMELLNGYAVSMPVLSHISIYYHASGNFLYADYSDKNVPNDKYGMFPTSQYCKLYFPESDQNAFLLSIDSRTEGGFYTSPELLAAEKMVYIIPVYIRAESQSRRAVLFVINKSSLINAYHSILGSLYTLDSIEYKNTCLYTKPSEENTHTFRYDNPDGFSITLSMPENTFSGLFTGYSRAVTLFGIASAVLCAGLITFFIFLTYKPLNQILRHTGPDRSTDEISAITGYIARKERVENELRSELDNEKQQIRLHSIEMLLLGIPTDQLPDFTEDGDPYHFVAVSPLSAFSDINQTLLWLRASGHILPYEQFRSGQLIMIVGSGDMDNMTDDFVRWFREHFGSETRLAVGSICSDIRFLHRSFLDALLSSRERENANAGSEKQKAETESRKDAEDPGALPTACGDNDEAELFRAQVIANDPSCISTAESMFASLDSIAPSFLYYWHSYCQMIEKIGGILHQYGYQIELNDYLRCMTEEDILAARRRFLDELKELVSKGPMGETTAEQEYGESIIQYINDNLSNELFGITDIIDCFNLSEYTVTKLIRDRTQMNFKRYLTHVRLEQAKQLLSLSQDSIQDIAAQCGFSSSSYFIRVFKAEVEVTPLQYRISLQSLSGEKPRS